MSILDWVVGGVDALRVADVACGPGGASMPLARRGALVTGLDFAPRTLEAARAEAEGAGLSIDYRQYDALSAPPADLVGRFDLGITISCLAMACSDEDVFERALGHVVSLVRPGGRFFFL